MLEYSHTREMSATGAHSEHLAPPASYASACSERLATKGLKGQRELGVLQCLKESVSPHYNSIQPSKHLSLILQQHSYSLQHFLSHILLQQYYLRLGILNHFHQFVSLFQMLIIYKGPVCPTMEYVSHVWGDSTHTQLFGNRVMSMGFCLIRSLSS